MMAAQTQHGKLDICLAETLQWYRAGGLHI
jgi:hypothetical protein